MSEDQLLEIEAEDVGGTSAVASLLTTVFSQYGTGGHGPHWWSAIYRRPV